MSGYDPEVEPNADENRPVLDLLGEAWDGADWTGEPHIQELIGAAIRNLKKANRWATFTDEELAALALAPLLRAEIAGEIARREEDAGEHDPRDPRSNPIGAAKSIRGERRKDTP